MATPLTAGRPARSVVFVGLVLFVGIGARFAVAWLSPGYYVDLVGTQVLARNVTLGGLPYVYRLALSDPNYGVYPPLYHCLLALVGIVYRRFFSPDFALETFWLGLLLKLVPIVGDALVGVIAYAWARRLAGARVAGWTLAAVLLNPTLAYNSAYWSMFGDALYTGLVLLALVAADRDRVGLAWGALTLGVLFKPQAVAFVPLVAWITLWPLSLVRWRRAGLAGGLVVGLVALPFVLAGTLPEAMAALRQTVGLFPVLSANAHNVWYLYGTRDAWLSGAGNSWSQDTLPVLGPLNARIIGLAVFCLLYVFILSRLGRARGWHLARAAALVAFGFFMLSTQMHENYTYPAVALLAVAWPRSRSYATLAVVLSLTALVNMVLHDPPLQALLSGPAYFNAIRLTELNAAVNLVVLAVWTWKAVRSGFEGSMAAPPAP